jgi:hypothetical protein
MRRLVSTAAIIAIGLTQLAAKPAAAQGYQIDCAILLCLAGGWPPSVPCARARAEFIRRITPWPIEPPLQIWRCPMRAAMNTAPRATPGERLYNYAFAQAPLQSTSDAPFTLAAVPGTSERAIFQLRFAAGEIAPTIQEVAGEISDENGISDIDISEPAFDFVRSIKVWNVMYYSHRERGRDDDCRESYNITLGTYGTQGDFRWDRSHPSAVPSWVIPSRQCNASSWVRAVGVEWRDYEGNHGFEVVRY